MSAKGIIALAAALVQVAALAAWAPVAAPSTARTLPATHRVSSLESSVLDEINDVRRAHHLVPLKPSARLDRAAAEHSRQMGAVGYFQHDSADGSAFWKRLERFYPSKRWRYWSVGENLLWASPQIDAPGAVKLWMESPEHRANLLAKRWREIGLSAIAVPSAPGAFHDLDVTIVTADFGVRD